MANIRTVATALPQHHYNYDDMCAVSNRWLSPDPHAKQLFDRFLRSSHANSRRYALSIDEILSLNGSKGRADLFAERATPLAADALMRALQASGQTPGEVDHLIFTSCSVPVLPSIDALVMERVGLPNTIHRVPIYQQGCAGGVIALSLAQQLTRAGSTAAVVSVELCSLVFHFNDLSPAQLVGSAIFADGAGCAVVGPDNRGWVFRAAQSYLIPNTRHLLGYDIFDDGAHLRLDSELPAAVAGHTPAAVRDFLRKNGLALEDIAWWLFHPGGVKVIDALEASLGLDISRTHWSRDVLFRNGNLSSATIFFVLEDFLKTQPCQDGEYVLMAGIGPGITVELILLQKVMEEGLEGNR